MASEGGCDNFIAQPGCRWLHMADVGRFRGRDLQNAQCLKLHICVEGGGRAKADAGSQSMYGVHGESANPQII